MRWCVFQRNGSPRIESSWINDEQDPVGSTKKKRFLIYRACPTCLTAYHCGSAFRQEREKVGVTLVDWESGIVHYWLSIFRTSRVIRTIKLHSVVSWMMAVSSLSVLIFDQSSSGRFIDSWLLNYLQFFHLMTTFDMSFTKIQILFWQFLLK